MTMGTESPLKLAKIRVNREPITTFTERIYTLLSKVEHNWVGIHHDENVSYKVGLSGVARRGYCDL